MVKERVTITLDEELLERLDRMAESTRENRSALIERLLQESITEEEILYDPLVQHLLISAMASPQVVESLKGSLAKALDAERFDAVARKLDRVHETARKPRRIRRR